jgi:prepilin-type N-terminal cleavage/methylation domain-containing protein
MEVLPLLRHRNRAGFTVIELMIGVVIVGILAALAIPSFKGYVYKGRVSEAVSMLNEIKTRQESYRSRHGRYAAVSGTGEWATAAFTPAGNPGSDPVGWQSTDEWEELGIRPPNVVRFRYATVAGPPGGIPPAGSNIPNDDFWFAAQARGDLDGDGDAFVMEVYSNSRIVYNSAAGLGGWQ